MIFKVSSNLNHSSILWFYDREIVSLICIASSLHLFFSKACFAYKKSNTFILNWSSRNPLNSAWWIHKVIHSKLSITSSNYWYHEVKSIILLQSNSSSACCRLVKKCMVYWVNFASTEKQEVHLCMEKLLETKLRGEMHHWVEISFP